MTVGPSNSRRWVINKDSSGVETDDRRQTVDDDGDAGSAARSIGRVADNLQAVIRSDSNAIRWLLAAFFSEGHVLLEDVPGTGKTTLAKALAASVSAEFKRIQFTPDLLPTDILGVSIYDQDSHSLRFRKGPIFTEILLADEINRASPRTQSALLEAMAEHQVSVEGEGYPMADLFFVIATQNPVEFHGTYPLPEAQMDRFAMRFGLGYVSLEHEVAILDAQMSGHPLRETGACITSDEVAAIKATVSRVRISPDLKQYIVRLVAATRSHPGVQLGASPRAGLSLMKCAQSLALVDGFEFVTPEAIQELAAPVIAHRLAMDPEVRFSGSDTEDVVSEILSATQVPV